MYKSQKTSPCTKCSNHGKTVVNHCPYWDCQCTSCKQTDILAALKLEHSQLMRGLHPGSLQKIGITENKKTLPDHEGTLTNKRNVEPKSLLDYKVKVADKRKMGDIQPVKRIDYKKSSAGVDENENYAQKNVGKFIKRESEEYREELKHESKGGFEMKSEYIEFESNIIESLAKPTLVIADALDELKYDCDVKTLGIKDKKKTCSLGVKRNEKYERIEDDGEPTQTEDSAHTDNINLKLSIVSLTSENLLGTSKNNKINPTHTHLGVKELLTVTPKRETTVEKDPPKTPCQQSSLVTSIGTLSNFISCKGIKVEEIDHLLESKIVKGEASGLKILKDIKTEVQKVDNKETDKFSCTQYLETDKFGQEMKKQSPSQKNKIMKVEDIHKIKSEISPVSSFDIVEENAINLSRFLTKVEKDEKGEPIRNIANELDPLVTVELEVPKIKEVKVDTVQFEVGNDNDPDSLIEKKQLRSKRLKFEQRKMPEKPKRRVYMKQNMIQRFKFEGDLHDIDRKDCGYREGGGNDVSGYGGGGGYNRDNSGYSVNVGNTYGRDRDYRGYKGKGRWGGNDEYDGGRDGCGYREENVSIDGGGYSVGIDGAGYSTGHVHGVGIDNGGYSAGIDGGGYGKEHVHGVGIDGGGYGKQHGYCGDRYGRGRNNDEYRGGGYTNYDGYRGEYGRTDCSGYGDGRNSGSSNGGGFKGGGGRDGGGFEESRGDCGVYGKGKAGVSDYGRNERGYGGGGQY